MNSTALQTGLHLHCCPRGHDSSCSSGASMNTPAAGYQHMGQAWEGPAHKDLHSVLVPWQTPSQNKTLLSPCTPELPKQGKSPAAALSPVPTAASPLSAQRLDHCGEEPPILGGDLCDVLRAADVRIFHRLGEGSASRTVAEGAREVAAVTCRHGSSGPLYPGAGTRETCKNSSTVRTQSPGMPKPSQSSSPSCTSSTPGPQCTHVCESSVPFNRLCEAALP